jgi:hypothetical protein
MFRFHVPSIIRPNVSTCLHLDCAEALPLEVRYHDVGVWHTLGRYSCDVAPAEKLTQNVVFTGSP